MAEEDRADPDWTLVGLNVRFVRASQSLTQTDLARAARVSPATVVSLERGRPVRGQTLDRICAALAVSRGELRVRRALNLKTPDKPCVVHTPDQAEWTAYEDRRPTIPPDNAARIQTPEERRRLGRLGLVPVFGTGPSFVMPAGPGVLIDEIFQAFEFPTDVYRDCVLVCLRGEVRVTVSGGEPLRLVVGGMVGFSHDVRIVVAPASPVDAEGEPPQVMWIGANRIGRLPLTDEATPRRVRRRAAPG